MKEVQNRNRKIVHTEIQNRHIISLQCLMLAKEQRATSQAIADSLDHVKTEALQLRAQICEELNVVEEKCDSNNLDPVLF